MNKEVKVNIISKDEFEIIVGDETNIFKIEEDENLIEYDFICRIGQCFNFLNIEVTDEEIDKIIDDVRKVYKEEV